MEQPPRAFSIRAGSLVTAVFLLVLGFSLWGVFVGWRSPNLYGNEFRQTQTAISSLFIQRDHDFSLAYPTPVLGKPWSVPMEFPLYQWTAVVTSNLTGLPLTPAGRLVSIVCFYLGLPALYLLLRRVRLNGPQSLIVLSLILCSPFYIFYARAFLMETMALMFGLWYLAALVKAIEGRSPGWLALVILAGVGAGLVKVTTFMFFLLPAFACSLWWLWQSRPRPTAPGWRPLLVTTGWLVAVHALPFAATLWWIRFSDAVKLLNPNGAGFTSSALTAYNFGLGRRFDPVVWGYHWRIITGEITGPRILLVGLVIAVIFGRMWWKHMAVALGCYALIQVVFPILYAWHAYYHIASAFLVPVALGCALLGAFESRHLPRPVAWSLWLVLLAVQIATYLGTNYATQGRIGNLGGLVSALRAVTRPDEVLVIAGDDWSSITPYYAERRALMVRGDVAHNEELLRRAFALLQTEAVGALVLMNEERDNALLNRLATEYLGIESEPFFTCEDRSAHAVVYLHRQIRREEVEVLKNGHFHLVQLVFPGPTESNPLAATQLELTQVLPRNLHLFRLFTPRPLRFYSTFGPEIWDETKPGHERFAAHPDTKLWFKLTAGHHELHTALELIPGAYTGIPASEASDGVELVAAAVQPDGRRDILLTRYINPRDNPADRGPQPIDWPFDLPAGAEFELSVNAGPHGNAARDWAALSAIRID